MFYQKVKVANWIFLRAILDSNALTATIAFHYLISHIPTTAHSVTISSHTDPYTLIVIILMAYEK